MLAKKVKSGFKLVNWYGKATLEIPKNWDICELGNICDEIYRYPTYYNIEYVKDGIPEIRGELIQKDGTLNLDVSYFRYISQDISDKFPRTILQTDDIIFSVRGTMGKIALIPKELSGSNITANLMRISTNKKIIIPKFLFYWMLSKYFKNRLNTLSPRTTIRTIQSNELKSIYVIIPKIPEQQKIISILSNIDSLISMHAKFIQKTKVFKKGLMQTLLTKELDGKKLKEIRLGRIAKFQSGEFLPEKNQIIGKIPVYGGNGIMGYHNQSLINFPTIIVGRVGAYCGSVHLTSGKSWITDNAIFIKDISNKIILNYLYRYLEILNINGLSEVSAQPKITQNILNHILIRYNEDKDFQQKIVSILSIIDSKIDFLELKQSSLTKIKKGLIQKLLTGEIIVGE